MKKFFATFLCLVLCGGLLPAQAAGPEVNAKAVLLLSLIHISEPTRH